MAWWDILKRDVRELFTTSATRSERRKCEFHLKVAEPMGETAFGNDDLGWREYYDELSRAVAAQPTSLEARYLRSVAVLHWFETMRPVKPDLNFRELARVWDRDLQFILTHFPDRAPRGMSLREGRAMREHFDRICRGIRV